jgi:hypothetical protein
MRAYPEKNKKSKNLLSSKNAGDRDEPNPFNFTVFSATVENKLTKMLV